MVAEGAKHGLQHVATEHPVGPAKNYLLQFRKDSQPEPEAEPEAELESEPESGLESGPESLVYVKAGVATLAMLNAGGTVMPRSVIFCENAATRSDSN